MKIIIEIDSESEIEKLFVLLEVLTINTVKVVFADDKESSITKGDKTIDGKSLFGIWANNPRSTECLRKGSW